MATPNPDWTEGDIQFDFSKARTVISLDQHGRGHGLSHVLKSVDFVVEWDNDFWLIEVKDPENARIPVEHRKEQQQAFGKKMSSRSLIHAELFPKFIDSLIFLGLDRGIPPKPMKYLTLIAMADLGPAQLGPLQDALKNHHERCLLGPAPRGWSKGFSVFMFTLELWNERFPHCRATRVARGAAG
ncbi:MAG: hypothetical protein H7831_12745 [Magnetococcus sp. WYHC-3]